MIRAKISLTFENSKPPNDNLSKNEWKAFKHKFDTYLIHKL